VLLCVGERERLVLAEVAAPPDVFDDIEADVAT